MNLNPLDLYINFLSSFDSELGGWFWGTILQITGSAQPTILCRNILRPDKPVQKRKTQFRKLELEVAQGEGRTEIKLETTGTTIPPSFQTKTGDQGKQLDRNSKEQNTEIICRQVH